MMTTGWATASTFGSTRPQQAWWWAKRRYGTQAAVVGALVRLGWCLDLLDPSNTALLRAAYRDLEASLRAEGQRPLKNANNHKYLDCAVFNWLYRILEESGRRVESCRAVFVPRASMIPTSRNSSCFRALDGFFKASRSSLGEVP
jgi:hypothetical protein